MISVVPDTGDTNVVNPHTPNNERPTTCTGMPRIVGGTASLITMTDTRGWMPRKPRPRMAKISPKMIQPP